MSEQQYRVVADRDKGDDPQWADIEMGDRYLVHMTEEPPDPIVRIERPVPTTGLPAPMHLTDAEAESFHAAMQEPVLPTREQIAEALYLDDADHEEWSWQTEDNAGTRAAYLKNADAVLALIQNGTDRG